MNIGAGKLGLFAIVMAATAILTGCGLANSLENLAGGGGNSTPGTNVVYTFSGTVAPVAAAVQIGSGGWSTVSISGGQLTVSVPSGTNNYSLAYVCPAWQGMSVVNQEYAIAATLDDGTALNVSCFKSPTLGAATGSADGTAIAGATNLRIVGTEGLGTALAAPSGSFSANMATGTNDVAVLADDNSGDVLGAKIVRAQTVPGAINGNNTITLAPSDGTTQQSITVTNIPSGFVNPAAVSAEYWTANGTLFSLMNNTGATQYAIVSSSEAQTGDYYLFSANSADTAAFQNIYVATTATSPGPVTLELPAPLPFAAPAPAAQPTFTLNYSGFSSTAASGDAVSLQWFVNSSTLDEITVYATAAALNGTTTVSVPDLTSLSGFFQTPASGTTVYWLAYAYGGTYPWFSPTPSSGTIAYGETNGQYTEP